MIAIAAKATWGPRLVDSSINAASDPALRIRMVATNAVISVSPRTRKDQPRFFRDCLDRQPLKCSSDSARSSRTTYLRPPLRTASAFGPLGIYCLFTPFCTAPVSLAAPALFGPAAVPAPEVLASPPAEGLLLVPVVPCCIAPSFVAPWDAPDPTFPWLDAPADGWAVWAKAVGVASAKIQAEANRILFIGSLPGFGFAHGER